MNERARVREGLDAWADRHYVWVGTHVPLGAEGTDGEAGYYHPNPNGQGPQIMLWRRGRSDVADDDLAELITLAHELGHHVSHLRGGRTPEYEAVVDSGPAAPDLSTEQRGLVLGEEVRAWKYGRELLSELGFTEWSAFDEREREALAICRRMLGIEP